jgi:hypothetical protein
VRQDPAAAVTHIITAYIRTWSPPTFFSLIHTQVLPASRSTVSPSPPRRRHCSRLAPELGRQAEEYFGSIAAPPRPARLLTADRQQMHRAYARRRFHNRARCCGDTARVISSAARSLWAHGTMLPAEQTHTARRSRRKQAVPRPVPCFVDECKGALMCTHTAPRLTRQCSRLSFRIAFGSQVARYPTYLFGSNGERTVVSI